MRACAICSVFAVVAMMADANWAKTASDDRIADLIKQLGDNNWSKREAASKELERIGKPALNALQKAATLSDDYELRRRAELCIQHINAVIHAAAAQLAAPLQGTWGALYCIGAGKKMADPSEFHSELSKLSIKGNEYTMTNSPNPNGTFTVDPTKKPKEIDLTLKGSKSPDLVGIYELDGDTLRICFKTPSTNAHLVRPKELSSTAENMQVIFVFKREMR